MTGRSNRNEFRSSRPRNDHSLEDEYSGVGRGVYVDVVHSGAGPADHLQTVLGSGLDHGPGNFGLGTHHQPVVPAGLGGQCGTCAVYTCGVQTINTYAVATWACTSSIRTSSSATRASADSLYLDRTWMPFFSSSAAHDGSHASLMSTFSTGTRGLDMLADRWTIREWCVSERKTTDDGAVKLVFEWFENSSPPMGPAEHRARRASSTTHTICTVHVYYRSTLIVNDSQTYSMLTLVFFFLITLDKLNLYSIGLVFDPRQYHQYYLHVYERAPTHGAMYDNWVKRFKCVSIETDKQLVN